MMRESVCDHDFQRGGNGNGKGVKPTQTAAWPSTHQVLESSGCPLIREGPFFTPRLAPLVLDLPAPPNGETVTP